MKGIVAIAATVAACVVGNPGICSSGASSPSTTLVKPVDFRLADAAPSVEVLLDRFLHALAKKDAVALHKLRVNEREYREYIVPGEVAEGQPPLMLNDTDSKFYWGMLNTKSLYAGQVYLSNHGGHTYKMRSFRFVDGKKHFAWFEEYDTAELTLEDEKGETTELRLGSIANVNGQFKFIGFLGD